MKLLNINKLTEFLNIATHPTEKKDSESPGEPGEPFEAFKLSEAKRISTRRQKVKGSVLVLEDLTSRPNVASTKEHKGRYVTLTSSHPEDL